MMEAKRAETLERLLDVAVRLHERGSILYGEQLHKGYGRNKELGDPDVQRAFDFIF